MTYHALKQNDLEWSCCLYTQFDTRARNFSGSEVKSLSCVQLFATPWTVAHQAPLSMRFSRQDYWNGLTFSSAGDLPDSGIEPASSALAAGFFTTGPPGKLGG